MKKEDKLIEVLKGTNFILLVVGCSITLAIYLTP